MDELQTGNFNAPQLAAIEYMDGASLVVAGAGSGKTRVLTYKIAYLMEHGYNPWNILALTFTNKAAGEMKQRIATIVGMEAARRLWMGTFHSIFLRILRVESNRLGFEPNFTIYDAADSKSLIKSIIKQLGLDDKTYKPGMVAGRISDAKNHLIDADEYAHSHDCYMSDLRAKVPELRRVYVEYRNRCRSANAMDFDDILVYTYRLFEKFPEVLEKYEKQFQYVLVDEYQDTNFVQHQIILQLTRKNQRVCVVGDDAQSIYAFRGADIRNILAFKDLYTATKVFKLEQNYRSTQMIVNAANNLIHKNKGQIEKTVFSKQEEGERIPIIEAYSDIEEAQIVVRRIQELKRRENMQYSDFAVLYRTNAQSRLFEENLRKNGLPYRIYGGLSFYQRKEIKDVIAYFRLAVNPDDEEALKRVINYPVRGIGQTTLGKLVDVAREHNVSLWTVLNNSVYYGLNITKGTAGKLLDFTTLIRSFIDKAATENAEAVGRFIIKESGIARDIYQDRSAENLSRQENLEELVNGLSDFCSSRLEEGNSNVGISDYLSEVSLLSDMDSDKDSDEPKITLMTIHSAKGLEFNTVFVVGLEENLFPGEQASGNPREIEEERRLFYVAVTRAERHLFISYAKSRLHYGKMEFGNPSRFINDLGEEFVVFGNGRTGFVGGRKDIELPWNKPHTQERTSQTYTQSSTRTNIQSSARTNTQTSPRTQVSAQSPSRTYSQPSVQSHTSTRIPMQSTLQSPSRTSASSAISDSGISVGQHVQHERFGLGVVLEVTGVGDNRKAKVKFANAGEKQLLLKFARLSVVD